MKWQKKKLSDNTSRRYCGRVHFDLTGPCNVLLDRFDFNFSWLSSQALDAKVIIFKKKRRKNYRRTKGHRQVNLYCCSLYYILFLKDIVAFSFMGGFKNSFFLVFFVSGILPVFLLYSNHFQELTKLRITNIEGIDKPETVAIAA